MRRNRWILSAAVFAAVSLGVSNPADATCGDGVLDESEACDDGNLFPGDCCGADCRVEESYLGCAGKCVCDTCADGLDNDGDGRTDAQDPKCATLSILQPVVWMDALKRECLAAPGTESANAIEACGKVAQRIEIESANVQRLEGADLDEIVLAAPASESTLSFGEGTSVLRLRRLHLGASSVLRLIGSPETTLVVQLSGTMDLGMGARVIVNGGLRSDRILWNALGEASDIHLAASSELAGTLLAPGRVVEVGRESRIAGGLYAREVRASAGD